MTHSVTLTDITVGIVGTALSLGAIAATVRLWLRARATGEKEVVSATVWSAVAAAPAVVTAIDFDMGLAASVIAGRTAGDLPFLATILRWWVLVGPALLVWSFLGLPWREQTRGVMIVRTYHVLLWALGAIGSMLALLTV